LVLAEVLHQGTGRPHCEGQVGTAIAFQGADLEVIEQRLAAVAQFEAPVLIEGERRIQRGQEG
jgi:hypothetical protein